MKYFFRRFDRLFIDAWTVQIFLSDDDTKEEKLVGSIQLKTQEELDAFKLLMEER